MDKISKALKKFSDKERKWVKEILRKLKNGEFKDLRIKKLKKRKDIYRVRKGNIRIIYRNKAKRIILLTIEKKSEHTYRQK